VELVIVLLEDETLSRRPRAMSDAQVRYESTRSALELLYANGELDIQSALDRMSVAAYELLEEPTILLAYVTAISIPAIQLVQKDYNRRLEPLSILATFFSGGRSSR
jgi:hypothetical protein